MAEADIEKIALEVDASAIDEAREKLEELSFAVSQVKRLSREADAAVSRIGGALLTADE